MTIDPDKTAHIHELPDRGVEPKAVFEAMEAMKSACGDVDWQRGRSWSLVYYGGEDHMQMLRDAYGRYFSENALSASAFPSLRRMEADVVSMIRGLFRGDDSAGGTMTSGGTESILLACKAYRDQARLERPGVTSPEILLPASAHPAFLKAAQYFGLRPVIVPLADDFRVDLDALRERLSASTVCIVASAPCYPYGVVDRIPDIAAMAQELGVGVHVDACLGGFLLPFMRELGEAVTDFDFAVPGVTSISADLHKNGYAAKGTSAVLYRDEALQQHQYFVTGDWPGGIYASATMLGTRPGGAIASAWAAMLTLGRSGYLDLVAETRAVTRQFVALVDDIDGLHVLNDVDANVVCVGSPSLDLFALADELETSRWRIDRQSQPDCLHHIVTPNHRQALVDYERDLRAAIQALAKRPANSEPGVAGGYGVTSEFRPTDRSDTALRSALAESLRLPTGRR